MKSISRCEIASFIWRLTWLMFSLAGNTFIVIDGILFSSSKWNLSFSCQTYSICGTSNRAAMLATIPRVCRLAGPKMAATPSSRSSQAIRKIMQFRTSRSTNMSKITSKIRLNMQCKVFFLNPFFPICTRVCLIVKKISSDFFFIIIMFGRDDLIRSYLLYGVCLCIMWL